MRSQSRIMLERVDVGSQRMKVWRGGGGPALLLLHGAWGGAEMHWGTVWERLAERYRVIAPELPGLGDAAPEGLPSFDAYAERIAALLAALDVESAWCVGNSFGAAVAWQLAARPDGRCRGVVLVNGVPPPEMPAPLRALAGIAPVRGVLRALFRRLSFSPGVLQRAFAQPALAPPELVRVLAEPPRSRLDLLLDVLLAGARAAPPPAVPVLLAWGASDRLPGTTAAAARKLQRSILGSGSGAGARLALIPSAGHCPQIEQPAEFVDAIESFIDSLAGERAAVRRGSP